MFQWKFRTSKTSDRFEFPSGIGELLLLKMVKIDQFLHEIPLKKIVLETDSPYLAPVPHRGKRNESSYLDLVVGKLIQYLQQRFCRN